MGGKGVRQTSVELFEIYHALEKRKGGFDQHSLDPLAPHTEFKSRGIARINMKVGIGHNDHFVLAVFDNAMGVGVMVVGGTAVSAHGLANELSNTKNLHLRSIARYVCLCGRRAHNALRGMDIRVRFPTNLICLDN